MTTRIEQASSSPSPGDGDAARTGFEAPSISLPKGGGDPRDRREVRRQPGHRHRLDVGADRHQPGPLGLRPAALAVLRLRRRQRSVRLRLEPLASRRSPARPTRACRSTATPRSRTSSSSPAPKTWCRSTGRTDGLGRTSGFSATRSGCDRGSLVVTKTNSTAIASAATARASRACSRASSAGPRSARQATSTGARSPRTTSSPSTASTRDSRIADPARRKPHLQLADLRDARRQGQRRPLPLQGGGRRSASISARRTSATAGRRTTSAARPTATSSASATATARRYSTTPGSRPRFLDTTRSTPDRQRRTGCSRWCSTTASTTPAAPTPDDARAHGPAAPDPFSTYRAGLRGPHLPPVPARADVPSLPGRADGVGTRLPRALHRLHLLATSQTPADVRNPVYTFLRAVTQTGYRRNDGGYDKRSLPPRRVRVHRARSCRTRCEEVDPREPGEPSRSAWTAAPTAGPTCTAKASPASSPSRPAPGSTSATSSPIPTAARRPGAREGAVRPARNSSPSSPTSR